MTLLSGTWTCLTNFSWMQTCFTNIFFNILWDILDTWPKPRSWDLSIRISGTKFRASQISQISVCVEMSHCELRKKKFFRLHVRYHSFSQFPTFMTIGEDWNMNSWYRTRKLWVQNSSTLSPQSDKVQAETTFASPIRVSICLLRLPSLLNTSRRHSNVSTWYRVCGPLSPYTALSFWKDIIPRSFQCSFSFRLDRTQTLTDQMHVKALLRRCNWHQIVGTSLTQKLPTVTSPLTPLVYCITLYRNNNQ